VDEQSSTPQSDSSAQGPTPAREGDYVVEQGDCIESIACRHGFFWKTIWDHPENSELKQKRQDPNILLEGDRVFIPELTERTEKCGTQQRHRFKRKGVPSKLRLVLKDAEQKPRPHVPYMLEIDGRLFQGETDADGCLQHSISPNAKRGRLIIGERDDPFGEEYELALGRLDPISELSGVQARLKSQRFYDGEIDGIMGPETVQAILDFQACHGLEQTGELSDETREKLKSIHGF